MQSMRIKKNKDVEALIERRIVAICTIIDCIILYTIKLHVFPYRCNLRRTGRGRRARKWVCRRRHNRCLRRFSTALERICSLSSPDYSTDERKRGVERGRVDGS